MLSSLNFSTFPASRLSSTTKSQQLSTFLTFGGHRSPDDKLDLVHKGKISASLLPELESLISEAQNAKGIETALQYLGQALAKTYRGGQGLPVVAKAAVDLLQEKYSDEAGVELLINILRERRHEPKNELLLDTPPLEGELYYYACQLAQDPHEEDDSKASANLLKMAYEMSLMSGNIFTCEDRKKLAVHIIQTLPPEHPVRGPLAEYIETRFKKIADKFFHHWAN